MASSPDCIPVVVLKNCEPKLSYVLAELFNMYLKESCLPDFWKVLSAVPVFKNIEERSSAKNYRPDLWQQLELVTEHDLRDTDVKMGESVQEEKLSFKMLVLTFSSKFDWGSYIISIARTASKRNLEP